MDFFKMMIKNFSSTLFLTVLLLFCSFSAQADLKGKPTTTGSSVIFTPVGNISATTVSGAIAELDTEKAPLASPTFTGTVNAAAMTASGNITANGRMIMPVGQVDYFAMAGTLVTIGSLSDGSTNMVAIAPTTAATIDTCFDNGGSNNGSLRYTCASSRYAHIAVTVSGTPATANDIFVFGVAKNGTVGSSCKAVGSASGTQFSALHCIMSIAQNDVITLRIGNTTAARNFTAQSLNIQAVLM
jgi:hypothetical protein